MARSAASPSSNSKGPRYLSLDAVRGLTIAGMIIVNCPGSDYVYRWVEHSDWNGCTFADLIFPSFLVIMGISLAVSLGRRLEPGQTKAKVALQALWRAILIYAFGMIISFVGFDHSGLADLRVTGVLQRISWCYFACALLFLWAGPVGEAVVCVALLLGYWWVLAHYGDYSPEGSIACILDRRWLGLHMLYDTHDPEGLLSTLPAIATTLLGVLGGRWLTSSRSETRKVEVLAAAGAVLCALGYVWRLWFPFNKQLWTSSYAVFTGGGTLLAFALAHWVTDILGWKGWAWPFEVLGRNALLAYFSSGCFYGIMEFVDIEKADGSTTNVKLWLTDHLFGTWLSAKNASLGFALLYLGICWAFMALLYRKKIFLKV